MKCSDELKSVIYRPEHFERLKPTRWHEDYYYQIMNSGSYMSFGKFAKVRTLMCAGEVVAIIGVITNKECPGELFSFASDTVVTKRFSYYRAVVREMSQLQKDGLTILTAGCPMEWPEANRTIRHLGFKFKICEHGRNIYEKGGR